MPAHSDRKNRKTLLRDLFAELPLDRQAVELEILGEINRLACRVSSVVMAPPTEAVQRENEFGGGHVI